MVYHVIALALRTTTLILVKDVLDVCGSNLTLAKKNFGYSFLCRGLGRGNAYDIST